MNAALVEHNNPLSKTFLKKYCFKSFYYIKCGTLVFEMNEN